MFAHAQAPCRIGIAGGGTSAELATFLQAEAVKWAAVIKAANVKLE